MTDRPLVMRQRRPPKIASPEENWPPVTRAVHQVVANKLEVARLSLMRIRDILGHARDWKQDIDLVRAAERDAVDALEKTA